MYNINNILIAILIALVFILITMVMFITQLDEINNNVAIISNQLQIDIINFE